MVNMTENINFNAQSTNSEGNIILTMSASLSDNKTLFFGKNITDITLYLDNKESADADYTEFEKSVFEKLNIHWR